MFSELIDVIDRRWAFVNSHNDVSFLMHFSVFLRQMDSEPRLRALLEGMALEQRDSLARYHTAWQNVCIVMQAVRDDLFRLVPEMAADAAAEPADKDDPTAWESFEEALKDSPLEAVRLGPEESVAPNLLVAICRDEMRRYPAYDYSAVRERVNKAAIEWTCAWRDRFVEEATSGGSALARMRDNVLVVHPRAHHAFSDRTAWMLRHFKGDAATLETELYGRTDSGKEASVASSLQKCKRDGRAIYEDVRQRLGEVRSLLAIMRRFKQRAEWYDAERLLEIARRRSRKGEDLLTEQMAVYLFDQGLSPLTQPTMGRLKPDCVAFGPRPLYGVS